MKLYFILILFLTSFLSYANEKVALQLKWRHQFQFAGYYAAKEKGFYEEAGLDVEIRERDLKLNNITQVINGDAQYGVADSVLLLYATKNQPVKIVTPIFQHSPSVILTLKSSGIDTPYKLQDKKLVFYKKDTDGFSILAMLKSINRTPQFHRIRETTDYSILKDKKADAYACYLTDEPFYFQELGVDINIINPANYGFDLYGDMLFTNAEEAKNHPLRVEKFKKATLKGWQYALTHKEEIIQLVKNKYATKKSLKHLQYEADAVEQMIQSKSIPLGSLDKGRVEYTLNQYEKAGLIKNDIPLDEYIFESFHREISLTPEENAYLLQKSTINMCIDPDWMPFEKNLNGKHIGMTADYFTLFEEQLNIPITMRQTKTWSESIEFGKQRKCDIFSLVMPTKSRTEYLDFTKAYLKIPLVIVTTMDKLFIDDISKIEDKKIGITKEYAYGEILREKYPQIQLVDVDTLNDGLEQVKDGKIFGFIGTLATTGYQIQKKYISQLKIAGKFDDKWELGIGTRNDEPILQSIFDKVIDNISEQQHQEIFNKWISVNYEYGTDYKVILKWAGSLSLLFAVILYIILRANQKLNKEIQNRKSVEQKLVKSLQVSKEQELLKNLALQTGTIGIWEWKYSTNTLTWNETMYHIYAISTSNQDNHYKMWSDAIVSNDKSRVEENVLKARKNNTEYNTKFWITTLNAQRKYIHAIGRNIFDNDGNASGMVGINIDITEQKNLLDMTLLQQQRYKSFMQLSSDGIFIMNANGKLLEYSTVAKTLLGYSDDEMKNLSVYDWDKFINEDEWRKIIDLLKSDSIIIERVHTRKDGSTYDAQITSVKIVHDKTTYIYAAVRDISQQKRINERINEKLQKFINSQNSIVILSDGKKVKFANKTFLDFFGLDSLEDFKKEHSCMCEKFIEQDNFFHQGKVQEDEENWIQSLLKLNGRQRIVSILDKNSMPHTFTISINKYENEDYILNFSDISDTMTEKLELKKEATIDMLTGVFNRAFFTNNIETILEVHNKNQMKTGIIFFDIDHFKNVNDVYGHEVGDYVLNRIATITKNSIRNHDKLIRWGGEEFLIICELNKNNSLSSIAEHVRLTIQNYEFKYVDAVTCSFGCVIHETDNDILETIKEADKRMYEAKRKGRNKIEC